MLVAFQVRSLLERPKVNDRARSFKLPALRYKKTNVRPFTVIGPGWLHDRFDMEHHEPDMLPVIDVCNQLIHYYWMQTRTEGQAFFSMIVFSDRKRHSCAYEFRIDDLLKLFRLFGDESSAMVGAKFSWNDKKQDYEVEKSCGPDDLFPH